MAALAAVLLLSDLPRSIGVAEEGSGDDFRRRVESAAKAFVSHHVETLESGNEEAIRALFVDDDRFAWFTDGMLLYSSADEVVASLKRYAQVRFETTLSDVRVIPLTGSLASVRSRFRTELTIPGAEDHGYGGVITWLLERSGSGKWKVLSGHTSTPGGPPGSDESR